MVGIPVICPDGGFPQLQAFSNGAFSFTVVILIVVMALLTVQVVLVVKMKCLAKWVTLILIPQSSLLQAIRRSVTVIARQDQVGNGR